MSKMTTKEMICEFKGELSEVTRNAAIALMYDDMPQYEANVGLMAFYEEIIAKLQVRP